MCGSKLLHAWELRADCGVAVHWGIDFEGDQFTFFKFPHDDLRRLFGLETHELAVWRPLTAHLQELIAIGRPVLVELDSYYLPDTAGTSYRRSTLNQRWPRWTSTSTMQPWAISTGKVITGCQATTTPACSD